MGAGSLADGGMDLSKLQGTAALLRERLGRSQTTSDQMISILGSFDERLSTLEAAMRPTQVQTHAFRKAHENIESTLKKAEEVLSQFDVSRQVEPRIKEGPRRDLEGYLKAVGRLQDAVVFFSKHRQFKSSDAALLHAKDQLKESLVRLEEDFRNLLASNSKSVDPDRLMGAVSEPAKVTSEGAEEGDNGPSSATSVNLPELLPPAVIHRLHAIAERLVAGGCAAQCTSAYRDVRDKTLEQSLKRLGVEKLKSEDVSRMQWEELEGRISGWIKHLRGAIMVLFAGEKKLCDQVLVGLDPYRERTFAELADGGATMLYSFGEAIARSKKSPEKLFVLLDMYETLRDLMPHVDSVFAGGPCTQIREMAHGLLQRLAQTARETFAEFEEAVEKDPSRAPVADGAVHPLTSYVINYIKFLFEYNTTLQQLFGGEGRMSEGDGKPRLAVATAKIMTVLQTNLEAKAKLFRDPALTELFLMNNVHYMVRSIRKSEAKDMLGDDWVNRHRRIVQKHATAYQRAAWNKVLVCLSPLGGAGGQGGETSVNRTAVKERFKQFNAAFEEVHARQCLWTIPDAELRSAVQLQVAEVLLPAYRSFLRRYSGILEQGSTFGKSTNPQKYIKYQAETVDALLGELFEGRSRGGGQPGPR